MKKIIGVILAVLMMVSSVVTTMAYDCYPVYGKAVVTDLVFKNSAGNEITAVPADGKISVLCNITKGADMYAQDATLIAAVYNGNQLKDIQADKKSLTDTKKPFKVDLENVAANSTVKVFVWDAPATAEPLAYAGVLGGKNAKLWDISIDGKTISQFEEDTKEYVINFPASYTSVPNISALAYELSTKVDVKYSYLSDNTLEAVIKTVSQDGSATETYKVTCNYSAPAITSIIAKTSSGDAVLTTKTVAKPSYKTKPSVAPSAVSTDAQKAEYIAANCNSFSPMYQLRDFYFYNYPSYLDGAIYPVISYEYRSDATYNGSKDALKLTLNRSATVYAVGLWEWASGYMSDWKNTGDKLEVVCVNNANWDSFRAPSIYYKRVEVPEGQESVEVTIEGIGSGKPQVVPFVVFDEVDKMDIADEESAAILGMSVDGYEIDGFVSDKFAYSVNVPEGYAGLCDVVATPANENTQVNYAESEINGNKVVTVTATYGSDVKEYVITFIAVESAITNAKAYTANGEVNLTFATANNPVFKTEPSVTPDKAAGKNDATEAEYYTSNTVSTSPFYTLRSFYMYNMSEELQGATYTLNTYDYRSDATFNDVTTPSMTFDINNSATIYITNLWNQEPAWVSEEGFTRSDVTLDCIEYNNNNFDAFRPSLYVWEKRVEVGIGETKTITIKGVGSGKPQEVAFVVFDKKVNTSTILSDITVDGKSIADFAPGTYEYTLNVPASYTGDCEVVGISPNSGADVDYSVSEVGGNKVVTITVSAGGNSQDYVVTFVKGAPAITNAKAYTANGAVNLNFATANNPVFKNEPSVTPDKAAGKNDATEEAYYTSNTVSTSPFYTSRAFYMYNMSEELQGATYTLNTYDYRSDATFNDVSTPSMTFDINNSATIYVTNLWNQEPAWVSEEGFTRSDVTLDCIEYNNNNFDAFRPSLYVWEKKVEVGIGETKTITIKGTGSGKPQEIAFVVWE